MLSGCKSRADDDASGFNKSMVRMVFVNGVEASDMLIVFRLVPVPLLSVFIRAKSTFELTYITGSVGKVHAEIR